MFDRMLSLFRELAFAEEAGFDYVGQYLRFLGAGATGTGL